MSHRLSSDLTLQSAVGEATPPARHPDLLHEFFERSARAWPDRVAVDVPPGRTRSGRRTVTYAELKRLSDRLAIWLQDRVTPACVIGIQLPRTSEHLYVAQLAAMKAGAAYACIDPAFPDAQFQEIMRDSGAVVLLTDGDGASRAAACGVDAARVLDCVAWCDGLGGRGTGPEPTRPAWLTPGSLAYVIYTSGTTGRPKGVMIEHRSVANLVAGDMDELGVSPADRVSQNSSSAYDSSVEEIWLGFAVGATLVVMDEETARLGPDLVGWLRDERITVLCPPPTMLRTMGCSDPAAELPDLRFVYVGGEALPRDVADRWAPGKRLVNGWGPTECTVTAIRIDIRAGDPISIGRPIPGLQAFVLNERLQPVPDGEKGELCVRGIGLARGYRHREALTAERFPAHPALGRIYRTGDLASREADGTFFYHGRIDGQVKIRGYRVELEAIETRLSECEGVREAACRVQEGDGAQTLVAFVVPERAGPPPAFDDLKAAIRSVLPAYMVPSRFGLLDVLPRTVGGKLNRTALPRLDAGGSGATGNGPEPPVTAPRTALESKVEAAIRDILRLKDPASIHADFFTDLAGDSLHAAMLVTLLREDQDTASVTVRDVYEAPTVARLAERIGSETPLGASDDDPDAGLDGSHPVLATLVQAAWLAAGAFVVAPIIYLAVFRIAPAVLSAIGLTAAVLLLPLFSLAALAIYLPLSVLTAVIVKRRVIGTYQPLRAPVWGSFYVRNWIVQRAVRSIPWRTLEGTVFQAMVLRALGARIGRRVHFHRGVNVLAGGWDLLDIGDEVSIGQDAAINLVDLDRGRIVVAPVRIGAGATVETRAGVGGGAVMSADSMLTSLSYLPPGAVIPDGERWDGIPACPAGVAPVCPAITAGGREWPPALHGLLLLLARQGVDTLKVIPLAVLALVAAAMAGVTAADAIAWINAPALNWSLVSPILAVLLLASPLALALEMLVMRAMGPVREGVISRWSLAYIRAWLKTELVHKAGEWLSGTLFWPAWLRRAGMTIGENCEISTIIDTVPELVEIGRETFFADGIYLGGPAVHRGTVTLARTRVGPDSFAGNHAVFPPGQQLPDGILVGVSTRADSGVMRPHSSWFGQPPFELVRREVHEVDRSLTHDPSWIRYVNRWLWEAARSVFPLGTAALAVAWLKVLAAADDHVSAAMFLWGVMPLATVGTGVAFALMVLALKWLLLGRVRPGVHPLWSCWCSRWDFFYVAWQVYARPPLSHLEGTLLLPWYLRAMGMSIGRRVVLGGGYSQVVDPDMLHFEDDTTVCCQFQAHTFEDRVLKIDHVHVRAGSTVGEAGVLLYGADIGERARILPHSVIMKMEHVPPGQTYAGCPSRPIGGGGSGRSTPPSTKKRSR